MTKHLRIITMDTDYKNASLDVHPLTIVRNRKRTQYHTTTQLAYYAKRTLGGNPEIN